MRVRNGYTIIELTVIIAIMVMLMGIFSNFVTYYRNYKNKIMTEYCSDYIMMFINSSKQYCSLNDRVGLIQFDIASNKMYFISGGKCRKLFVLPGGCQLVAVNTKNGKPVVNINDIKYNADACTIKYKDSNNIIHIITIGVGTSYVEIKS